MRRRWLGSGRKGVSNVDSFWAPRWRKMGRVRRMRKRWWAEKDCHKTCQSTGSGEGGGAAEVAEWGQSWVGRWRRSPRLPGVWHKYGDPDGTGLDKQHSNCKILSNSGSRSKNYNGKKFVLQTGLLPSPCFYNFLARTTFVLESLPEAKNPGQDAFFWRFCLQQQYRVIQVNVSFNFSLTNIKELNNDKTQPFLFRIYNYMWIFWCLSLVWWKQFGFSGLCQNSMNSPPFKGWAPI